MSALLVQSDCVCLQLWIRPGHILWVISEEMQLIPSGLQTFSCTCKCVIMWTLCTAAQMFLTLTLSSDAKEKDILNLAFLDCSFTLFPVQWPTWFLMHCSCGHLYYWPSFTSGDCFICNLLKWSLGSRLTAGLAHCCPEWDYMFTQGVKGWFSWQNMLCF